MTSIPQWIKNKGELVNISGQGNVTRISQTTNSEIIFYFIDGTNAKYPYDDDTDATAAFSALESTIQAQPTESPALLSISMQGQVPTALPNGSTPIAAIVTGINFDPSAAININSDYGGSMNSATVTWVSSTCLLITIPSLIADTYDLVYSDSNGATATLQYGLVVT